MSRGGRGGFGGGRARVGGVEIPWEIDFKEIKHEYKPNENYPEISKPAYQKAPRVSERRQVAAFRRLRDNIHEGDFYTVLGPAPNSARIAKKKSAPAAPSFDAFESMETYTHKYTKQRRRLPRLQGRPFVMRFFPKELRATIDPAYGKANGAPAQRKRRVLRIHRADRRSRMEMGMDRAEREAADDVDDDNGAPDTARDDDELEKDAFDEEPVDDDFEEDEDDMDDDNDYNAERYFDGGDEDGGEDDYGGGGMGEDEY